MTDETLLVIASCLAGAFLVALVIVAYLWQANVLYLHWYREALCEQHERLKSLAAQRDEASSSLRERDRIICRQRRVLRMAQVEIEWLQKTSQSRARGREELARELDRREGIDSGLPSWLVSTPARRWNHE